jgi:hypothetical protein
MTLLADLNAISLTGTAKSASLASGADLSVLVNGAKQDVIELKQKLLQIAKYHPQSGGDSANYAALQAVITSLG